MGKSGKSTMINALLGEELLPSGNTTTTGNIIDIGPIKNKTGRETMRVHRTSDSLDKWEEQELQVPGSSPRVPSVLAVDMSIDRIQVEHRHEIFRHNVTILDAPGYARLYTQ
jgi:ribosome biogenesis GTPase A